MPATRRPHGTSPVSHPFCTDTAPWLPALNALVGLSVDVALCSRSAVSMHCTTVETGTGRAPICRTRTLLMNLEWVEWVGWMQEREECTSTQLHVHEIDRHMSYAAGHAAPGQWHAWHSRIRAPRAVPAGHVGTLSRFYPKESQLAQTSYATLAR